MDLSSWDVLVVGGAFINFVFLLFLINKMISYRHSSSPCPCSLECTSSLVRVSPRHALTCLHGLSISACSTNSETCFDLLFARTASGGVLSLLPYSSLVSATLSCCIGGSNIG